MYDWQWELIVRWLPILFEGMLKTLELTVVSIFLGSIIALFLALARISKVKIFNTLAIAYIEFFRGTPLLVQILLLAYALPMFFDYTPNLYIAGVAALSLNAAAYIAEIFRGGIQSIDRGQMEASRSLGMTYRQSMRFIIWPQAFRRIIPPLGNQFVAMLKDSSLVFAIGIEELMTKGRLLQGSTYRSPEVWFTVALIYLVLTLTFSYLVNRLERRLSISDSRS